MTDSTANDLDDSSPRARRTAAAALLSALTYAVVRYVVVGTVPASEIPVFIVNKATAVAAVLLLAGCLAIGPLVRMRRIDAAWMRHRKQLGLYSFALASLHALLTVATLSTATYGKLFTGSRLSLTGGLVVLAGVLAFGALVVPAFTSADGIRRAMGNRSWRAAQRLTVPALVAALVHVVALGWRTWLVPETWPGGLPPLTLIAVLPIAASLAARIAATRRRRLLIRWGHVDGGAPGALASGLRVARDRLRGDR